MQHNLTLCTRWTHTWEPQRSWRSHRLTSRDRNWSVLVLWSIASRRSKMTTCQANWSFLSSMGVCCTISGKFGRSKWRSGSRMICSLCCLIGITARFFCFCGKAEGCRGCLWMRTVIGRRKRWKQVCRCIVVIMPRVTCWECRMERSSEFELILRQD